MAHPGAGLLLPDHGFWSNTEPDSDNESDDEEEGGGGISYKMLTVLVKRLIKQVTKRQDAMQQLLLDKLEMWEAERTKREQAWRAHELTRIKCEWEQLAQERATGAARDAALIMLLQRIITSGNSVSLPPSFSSLAAANKQKAPVIQNTSQIHHHIEALIASMQSVVASRSVGESSEGDNNGSGMPRWPKEEVDALIQLRMEKDELWQDLGGKAPLWDDISAAMRNMGYHRSSKRCKEKWENINKYFKKVKESKKRRPQDAKTCPYFHQLEDIYRKRQQFTMTGNGGSSSTAPGDTMVIVTFSEQPVLEQNHQCDLQGNIGNNFGMMVNDGGENSHASPCNDGHTGMHTTVLDDIVINEEENTHRELVDKINNDSGMVENIEGENLHTTLSNDGDTAMVTVVLDDSSINKEENPHRELRVRISNKFNMMGNDGGENLLAPSRNGGDTPMDNNMLDDDAKNKQENPSRELEVKISKDFSMVDNGGGENLHAPRSKDGATTVVTAVLDESAINIEENLLAPPCNGGDMAIDTAVIDGSSTNKENRSRELESKISNDFIAMDNVGGENLLSPPSNNDDTDENQSRELEGNISNDFSIMGKSGGENLLAPPSNSSDTTIDTTVLDDNAINNDKPSCAIEGKINNDFAMRDNIEGENLIAPSNNGDTTVDTTLLHDSVVNKEENPLYEHEVNINNHFSMMGNGGVENLLAPPNNNGEMATDTVVLDDNAMNKEENPSRELEGTISNDFAMIINGGGENLLSPLRNDGDTTVDTTVLDGSVVNKEENPGHEHEVNISNHFGMMGSSGRENLLVPRSNNGEMATDTVVLDDNAINKEENPSRELEGNISNDFAMMINGRGENLLSPPRNDDDTTVDTAVLDESAIKKEEDPWRNLEGNINNDFNMIGNDGGENLLAAPCNGVDTAMGATVLYDNAINHEKNPLRELEDKTINEFAMMENSGEEKLLASSNNGGDTAMDTTMLDDSTINKEENPRRELKGNVSNDFDMMGSDEGENLLAPPSNSDDIAMDTSVLDDIPINKENPLHELGGNINNEFVMMGNDGGENLFAPPSHNCDTTMDTAVLDDSAINKEENPWRELEGNIRSDFSMMDNGGGENLLAPPNNIGDKAMDTTVLDDSAINKENPWRELKSKINNDFKMMDNGGWENLLAPPSNNDDTTMDTGVLDDNPVNKKKEDIVMTTEANMQPQQKDFTDWEETCSDDIEGNYTHEDRDNGGGSSDNENDKMKCIVELRKQQ